MGIKYRIRNEGGDSEVEMLLFDAIGADNFGGISAKDFAAALQEYRNAKQIRIRINSPGGSVFEGLAMHDAIRGHPARIITQGEGLVASAATVVHQAGRQRLLTPNTQYMVHNSFGMTVGDHREHQKTAELLRKMDDAIAGVYAKRSGRRVETFLKMMGQETWMSGSEAVAEGLADRVCEDAACPVGAFYPSMVLAAFKRAPRELATSPAAIAARLREIEVHGESDRIKQRLEKLRRDELIF